MMRETALLVAALAGSLWLAGPAAAQDARPHQPLEKAIGTPSYADRPVPSLAVINSAGARLDGSKLVLTGVSPNTIVFADRPVRAAGHEMTSQFIMQWDKGKDSFENDPPNATISALGAKPGEVGDAVVVLKSPKLEGSTLTFDVSVLEGNLAGASGPAALFIDWFAARGFGGGVAHFGGYHGATFARGPYGGAAHWGGFGGTTVAHAGYWHAPVYHGAWYAHPVAPVYGAAPGAGLLAGALIGAAAANAAAQPCGYYPYPACY